MIHTCSRVGDGGSVGVCSGGGVELCVELWIRFFEGVVMKRVLVFSHARPRKKEAGIGTRLAIGWVAQRKVCVEVRLAQSESAKVWFHRHDARARRFPPPSLSLAGGGVFNVSRSIEIFAHVQVYTKTRARRRQDGSACESPGVVQRQKSGGEGGKEGSSNARALSQQREQTRPSKEKKIPNRILSPRRRRRPWPPRTAPP